MVLKGEGECKMYVKKAKKSSIDFEDFELPYVSIQKFLSCLNALLCSLYELKKKKKFLKVP